MTEFEKTYDRLFRTRGVDTKHMADCELIWDAANKCPKQADIKLLDTGAPRGGERNWHYVTFQGVEVFGSFQQRAAAAYRDALVAKAARVL